MDSTELVEKHRGAGITAAARAGWVRTLPHFYIKPEEIDRALELILAADARRWTLIASSMARKELIVALGSFFSSGDEKSFFDWLQSISCVHAVQGRGRSLHITLRKQPTNSELRELIALLFRYRLEMKPLAALKNGRNSAWFYDNKDSFWHARVFGKE